MILIAVANFGRKLTAVPLPVLSIVIPVKALLTVTPVAAASIEIPVGEESVVPTEVVLTVPLPRLPLTPSVAEFTTC